MRKGLKDVKWPGRFELLRKDPLFIIDGGHNPQCIEALVKNIDDYLAGRPLTVLTGVLGDKDFHCMYANVAPFAKEFITVTPGNPRALDAKDLAKYLATFGKPVTPCETVADGVKPVSYTHLIFIAALHTFVAAQNDNTHPSLLSIC